MGFLFVYMKNILNKIKSKLSKKLMIIIGVVVVIFIGFRVYSAKKATQSAEKTTIQKGNVSNELILSGEVTATEYANLTFPTSGKLSWVGVAEGNQVKKGQALVSLDKTVLNAAYQDALNNVRKYEANVDYVHDNLKDKDTTENFEEKDTRTAAEVAKDNAYDALKAAEYNLANATLTAPFTGFVTFLAHPYSGVNILVTETQVVLLNPDTIYFEVTADQSEVIDIKNDQKVVIIFDSYPDKEFNAKVTYIAMTPKENESGTVYKVKVVFDESNLNILRIGMTGDAKFILETKENVLYLPSEYIHADVKGKYIFLGNPKNKVYIETGIENEDTTEVSGNVQQGDTVFK